MNSIKVKWLSIVVLVILVVYGLWTGLMYSLNFELNSDTVVPGLIANDIFSHGNIQYDFPVNDPYIFTDIYTFDIWPQFLSGYDPTVLRLTAYAMFIIAIAIFSFIVYRYTGTVSALMFAALTVNLGFDAYTNFISPERHVGTLIATGLLIILLDFDRAKKSGKFRMAACVLIAALVLLSDSIFLALFIIPYVACYLLFFRGALKKNWPKKKLEKQELDRLRAEKTKELRTMDMTVILLVVVPVLVLLFKTFEPKFIGDNLAYFNPTPMTISDLHQALVVNLPLYFQCLAQLVNQALFNVLSFKFSLMDIPIAIVFLGALSLAATRPNKQARYIYMMFLLSGVVVFLGFIFLGFAVDLWSSRFLIVTAISIFAVIALAYDEKDDKLGRNALLLVLVLVLVIYMVPISYSKIASLDNHPNQEQYDLIGYMESHGYTNGVSDYDHSNLISYLSREHVELLAVQKDSDMLTPYSWLASSTWYLSQEQGYFVMAENNTKFYDDVQGIIAAHPPKQVDYYKDYTIYIYNMSK
jgi:hypothetical protein